MHLSQIPEAVGVDFAIPARPCLFSPSNIPVSVADILSMQDLVPGGASPSLTHVCLWGRDPWHKPVEPFSSFESRGAWRPHWVLLHPGFCRVVQTVPLASFPIKPCLLLKKAGWTQRTKGSPGLGPPRLALVTPGCKGCWREDQSSDPQASFTMAAHC